MSHEKTNELLLKVDHVTVQYGEKPILRDVNAEIYRREGVGAVICFLGPSGIGKTQLSRVIAGFINPRAGAVLLRGAHPVNKGDVSMVPQNYPMFEYLTVKGNLAIAGKQAGHTKDQINDLASTLINEFGLSEHLDKYPRDLSGGTRQRVAIARQLMCAGHYMVMDEPFSGLDPLMKRVAMDSIVKLSRLDGYNMSIVVTHDILSGMAVADRVWLMGLEPGIPGARLVEDIDLAEKGLAYRDDIQTDPEFLNLVSYVNERFKTLKPQ